MKKDWQWYLFIGAIILAWPLAYGPDLFSRQQTFKAVKEPSPHWTCLLDSRAVGYNYDGVETRAFIVLGDQRYYSPQFRRWEMADPGRILLVIDAREKLRWTRLTRSQAIQFANNNGMALTGCKAMGGGSRVSNAAPPSTLPPQPLQTDARFSWEKALAPALAAPHIHRMH